ncbi:MAG: Os1348 family NHLP clan protein [Bdellovibrionota bacterium]|nr:Os1348 family NHLP clan protein [Bdellovibrionota bacterium]
MAVRDVKKVLDRAHEDQDFHDLLLKNPDEALKDYSLTEKERERFKTVTSEKLSSYKLKLDKRYSLDGSESDEDDWWAESVTD